jgi:hypothetical protein
MYATILLGNQKVVDALRIFLKVLVLQPSNINAKRLLSSLMKSHKNSVNLLEQELKYLLL